jgi:hypothetical protein
MLRGLEWFATRFANVVIADNAVLVDMARKLHRIEPTLIAYGGDHTLVTPDFALDLGEGYFLSVARIEPENNCHQILSACAATDTRMVFIGNWDSSAYGRSLKRYYAGSKVLTLLDPIYDLNRLAAVRASSGGYIHGHSVGGTNPSLVEALFHTNRIFAFDCAFNRATLADNGSYFGSEGDLVMLLGSEDAGFIDETALVELRGKYRWSTIVDAYLAACL